MAKCRKPYKFPTYHMPIIAFLYNYLTAPSEASAGQLLLSIGKRTLHTAAYYFLIKFLANFQVTNLVDDLLYIV